MMSAACQGFMADSAAETEAAVICSVSVKASAGDMAASHLLASPGRSLPTATKSLFHLVTVLTVGLHSIWDNSNSNLTVSLGSMQ